MASDSTPSRRTTSPWLYVAGLAVIAAFGLLLRIWVTGRTSAEMNSDEYFTGLQAMAILEGDRPII